MFGSFGPLASLPRDERKRTLALYERVRAAYARSNLATMDWDDFELAACRRLLDELLTARPIDENFLGLICSTIACLADAEQLRSFPELPTHDLSMIEAKAFRDLLRRFEHVLANPSAFLGAWEEAVVGGLKALLRTLPPAAYTTSSGELIGTTPFIQAIKEPLRALDWVLLASVGDVLSASALSHMRREIVRRSLVMAGIAPSEKEPPLPSELGKKHAAKDIAWVLFNGTPYQFLLQADVPVYRPFSVRFEHTEICAGSGHGKTQLLQHMILRDLDALKERRGSLIVIDSQGDMLRNITRLGDMRELHDNLIYIDPNNLEHPPALNLFDFGLDRLKGYNQIERERLTLGAISLYSYLFGALLKGALTQRQELIFRFLARLMMASGGTIHTLRGFMANPESVLPYLDQLDPISREFFQTEFLTDKFDDTRSQLLTRIWSVLSNPVLERMFSHERNKVDLFAAMNRGSLILINTAKDLLKEDGCAIFGRFWIALITQAAEERASIPEDRRRATMLYIDEAADYFSESMETLFSTLRKYKVGTTIAHQYLDQFDPGLRGAVMASTSTKIVGGLSAKDAATFAREMHCEPEFLQGMRKGPNETAFACHVRNVTTVPLKLTVPLGEMEERDRLSEEMHEWILATNRARYAGGEPQQVAPGSAPAASFVPEVQEPL